MGAKREGKRKGKVNGKGKDLRIIKSSEYITQEAHHKKILEERL